MYLTNNREDYNWESKRRKTKKPCDEKDNVSTANVPAAKKAMLSSDIPGSCAYHSMVLREQN